MKSKLYRLNRVCKNKIKNVDFSKEILMFIHKFMDANEFDLISSKFPFLFFSCKWFLGKKATSSRTRSLKNCWWVLMKSTLIC